LATENWSDLDYAGFARLAADQTLSKYEKIGFPDAYRAGFEDAIFADIRSKLPGLEAVGGRVLDIGPGCSDLATMVIDLCRDRGHSLTVIDSEPMLALLPSEPFIDRRPGLFPTNRKSLVDLSGAVDTILMYSVFQYIFIDANPFDAIDLCLDLLAPGGRALIGDIPNISMRNRFFASPAGLAFHHAFTGRTDLPPPMIDGPAAGLIDDSVIAGLLLRIRASGAHAYIMPQGTGLPMQNRREDLLICKP
jgi:hypothetical protein